MDHKTSLTQHINAPADKVWAVISDIPGSAATLSSIDSIQMLTEGPYAEGTRWKETRTMMRRAETVEMWVSQSEPPSPSTAGGAAGSTTVKALQGGADYTTRFVLADRDGGTDLTLTFGAEVVQPTRLSKVMMAVFGAIGMRITRKALAKDLAEIAAKAESL
ncbi:SRPBCC family protein [Pseudarthrobacter sp. O4]|uniref:SRPBCC family protein n=1 Tax=Pseudarthrobacter sp. O4 TaxID=3418417 RepID=UPI003CFA1885